MMDYALTETDLILIRTLVVEGKTGAVIQLIDSLLLADCSLQKGVK